jgi:molecular chaperone DnaJ
VARTCGQCRGQGSVITKPCQTCRGVGRVQKERKLTVRIPAGIATGQRLRLSGEGEAGVAGGPRGDLYVVIDVQEHAFFQRDGNDLLCEIPLQFTTLALGGQITVPTLDGHASLAVPEGTESGAVFRVRGRGMPDVTGRGNRGDLLVTVKVLTPKKLTKEQRKLLEQLDASLPKATPEPTPLADQGDKGLFDRVRDIFG